MQVLYETPIRASECQGSIQKTTRWLGQMVGRMTALCNPTYRPFGEGVPADDDVIKGVSLDYTDTDAAHDFLFSPEDAAELQSTQS